MTPPMTPDCNHDAPASFAAPTGSAALARIEKLCAAYIDLSDGETGKDRDDLLDAAWLVIRQVYEIAIVENVKPPNQKVSDERP